MSEDPTQLTQRTILEAINTIGVELHNFRALVERRFEEVNTSLSVTHTEILNLRAEVNIRFDELEESLSVLAGDVVKLRARDKARPRSDAPYPPDETTRT